MRFFRRRERWLREQRIADLAQTLRGGVGPGEVLPPSPEVAAAMRELELAPSERDPAVDVSVVRSNGRGA